MLTDRNVVDSIYDKIDVMVHSVKLVPPCDEHAKKLVLDSWAKAFVGMLAASTVNFNIAHNVAPVLDRLPKLGTFAPREIIGPVGHHQCGILRPYGPPSFFYESVLLALIDPDMSREEARKEFFAQQELGGLSRDELAQFDATVKPWPEHQEAHPDQRDQSSQALQVRKRARSSSEPRRPASPSHRELALGQHRRIGYRHASLMGVETEGPAPQGGLVLAASRQTRYV